MSTDGLQPVLVDQYGGLVTLIDRSDLPVGVSPDCQNVEFFPGGVRSRAGFGTHSTPTGADFLSFTSIKNDRYVLVYMADGTIKGGLVENNPTDVPFGGLFASTTLLGSNMRIRGTTLFGRAFFGIYGGWDNRMAIPVMQVAGGPLQYNGASIQAVSPAGPCASFTVTPGGGGSGTISAGRHSFCVVYVTATEYTTRPSDIVGNTFGGTTNVTVAALPIGVGPTVRRVIFATPANSTEFFTLPRFAVNDNATLSVALDFTDAELMSGQSLEDFVDQVSFETVMGVEKYGSRLVYWGGLATQLYPFIDTSTTTGYPLMVGLQSLTFDNRSGVLPYPWTVFAGPFGVGGSVVTSAGAISQVYQIDGDGVTLLRGRITQGPQPNLGGSGTYFLVPGKTYRIRARIRRNATVVPGDTGLLNIEMTVTGPTSGTTVVARIQTSVPALGTDWGIYESTASTAVPADAVSVGAEVYTLNTVLAGRSVQVDWIEPWEDTTDVSRSTLAVSQVDDPEYVNPTVGLVNVAPGDGQEIRNVFPLRGNLYVCKESSTYVVSDNSGDPSEWAVDTVSSVIGTPSPHGVAVGDGWALIVDRNGLYHFSGGVPEKLSQEIQPTWDGINWAWSQLIWTALDISAQRLYIGAPFGTARAIDKLLVLDFVEGFGDPISGGGQGRKWSVWPLAYQAGAMIERSALISTFFAASATGYTVKQVAGSTADEGVAFTSYYETAPIGTEIGRSLFDRLIMRIRGSGSLTTQSRTPGGTLTTLTAKTLSASPDDDIEIKFHNIQTQLGFRIGTSGATDYWSLRRLGAFLKQAPFSYLRKT